MYLFLMRRQQQVYIRTTTRQNNTNDGGSIRVQGLLSALIDINLYRLSSSTTLHDYILVQVYRPA